MSIQVNKTDHVQGNENAKIELIEYGDYQCPYCRKAHYIIKEIQKELGNNLKFVFRNFPLVELHPNALNASVCAEVAGGEGKFWQMHDILFENQRHLDDSDLIKYAKEIGMNEENFKNNFGKEKFLQKIKNDYNSGMENDVEGTPTFFINGEVFNGNWMTSELSEYLRSLVK